MTDQLVSEYWVSDAMRTDAAVDIEAFLAERAIARAQAQGYETGDAEVIAWRPISNSHVPSWVACVIVAVRPGTDR